MLAHLHISNFVLIDSLDLDFVEGFTAISGETGAGKSILLGALSLAMGARADTSVIAPAAEKCTIEATFKLLAPELEKFFLENDLDYDAEVCIIRRELTNKGRSRTFINDSPVPLSTLKGLSECLIDIHSQHKNLILGNADFQRSVLDLVADNDARLAVYAELFSRYDRLRRDLNDLENRIRREAAEQDYLAFVFRELSEANLKIGEEVELETERSMLAHALDIRVDLGRANEVFENEDFPLTTALRTAEDALRSVQRYMPEAEGLSERLRSARIDLEDVAESLARATEEVRVDPERLRVVEDRLDLLNRLMHKHNCSDIEKLIAVMDQTGEKLEAITDADEKMAQLTARIAEAYGLVAAAAGELHAKRVDAVPELVRYISESMPPLGIPQIDFRVRITETPEPATAGCDHVTFLFSANKHMPAEPVADIASGGEIARLMLCLKALMASKRELPTILFDEIDTGISGDIADRMGSILQQMGERMQVIAITHLPQIAARGDAHLYVYKETDEDRTSTCVRILSGEHRIREIARMQSGATPSALSLAAAEELIIHSRHPADKSK